jgi:hypothetical protein
MQQQAAAFVNWEQWRFACKRRHDSRRARVSSSGAKWSTLALLGRVVGVGAATGFAHARLPRAVKR